MMFNNLVGNEKCKEALSNIVQNDKIANGYIFFGPNGIGKKLFAINFAKLLNCESIQKPCESCIQCIKITNSNHPDFLIVTPEKGAIKIDQVREIQKMLAFSNLEAKYRCILVDDADKMNTISQNAFLKILEEPPDNTIFVLVTSNINSILPTIISRCQKIGFSPISECELGSILGNKSGSLYLKSALSSGSIADSNTLDESALANYMTIIENLFKKNEFDIFEITDDFTRDRDEVITFLKMLYIFVADGLLVNAGIKKPDYLKEYIDKVEETLKIKNGVAYCNLLDSALNSIDEINRNCNITLCLENLFLEVRRVRKIEKEDSL